jgi:hypothetical protein
MDIKSNKKAVLFSLISVLFSVLFVTMFSQNFSTIYEDRIPGSNIRIKVMDTHARNFETYLGDSIKISTYRTLDNITRIKKNDKTFFNDFTSFNTTFYECMTCGYTDCITKTTETECNKEYYLVARLNNITNLSEDQLNIKTTYKINSIIIEPESAFFLKVKVNISYNVSDSSDNYARWNKNILVTQSVSILGLLDPMSNINNATNRTIKKYTGTCEGNTACWTPANTLAFYQDMSFTFDDQRGVSFLQRYWNDTTPSEYGIETILHPSEINIPDGNRSYIEHYYWNNAYSCSNVSMTIHIYQLDADRVSLDSATATLYGLTIGDIVGTACKAP